MWVCVCVILLLCCVPFFFCLFVFFLFRHYLVRHGGCGFFDYFLLFVQSGVSVSLFAASVYKKMAAAVRGKTQHEVRRDSILITRLSRVYLKYVFFVFLKSCSESIFIWNLFLFPLYAFFFENLYKFDSRVFFVV